MYYNLAMNIANILQSLSEEKLDAVYLYGSRAKGTATASSDWDLAVLFSDYEPDVFERAVRPQLLQFKLADQFDLGDEELSIVDLENTPFYLQYNILQGEKLFDRGVPHVRRVENAIMNKAELDYGL